MLWLIGVYSSNTLSQYKKRDLKWLKNIDRFARAITFQAKVSVINTIQHIRKNYKTETGMGRVTVYIAVFHK